MEYEREISGMLKKLGMPANLCGFDYLKCCIAIGLHTPLRGSITHAVYPVVAQVYNTTPSRVERCIRKAIEVLWERGDMDELDGLFGYSVNPEKGRPTNMEFISTVCEYLNTSHAVLIE